MARAPATVLVLLSIAVVTAGLLALAGALAINTIQVHIAFIQSPILVEPGENTGGTDIAGSVTVVINGSKVNVTVHPTYHVTVYPSLINVTNTGNTTLYLSIAVDDPVDAPNTTSTIYLVRFDRPNSTIIIFANLSAQGTYGTIELRPTQKVELGLVVIYPEGQPLATLQGRFYIAASTVNETAIIP